MIAALLVLSHVTLSAPAQSTQPPLVLLKQEFNLFVEPEEGKIAAHVTWALENRTDTAISLFNAYLADMAELTDVSSPQRKVTWKRLPALVPFFSAARITLAEPLGARERLTIDFRYRMVRGERQTGLAAMSMSLGPEEIYLFECWYPTCEPFIDENSFIRRVQKAPFSLTVTVPESYVALSVGERSEPKVPAGRRTYRYESGSPAPFLIPLVVARFTSQTFTDLEAAIPVELYSSGTVDRRKARGLADYVTRAATTQAQLLERPRPRKLRLALISSGGLCRGFPGLLVLPPHLPLYWHDPQIKSTICHELSHTYFGNLVTAYGPGGNEFLSEGLATFMGIKTVGILDGPEAENSLFATARRQFFNSEVEDVPIVQVRPMQNVLSGEVYRKGALVFNELGRWLGEAALWRLLADFLRHGEGGFADLSDFRQVAARPAATRDIAALITQSLETTHMPWVMLADYRCVKEGADAWQTEGTLSNRGDGFGLVPLAAYGEQGEAITEHVLVPAKGKKRFAFTTTFRVTRCTIDPDHTFLHGVRRASMLRRGKDLRQKGSYAAARTAYERLLDLLPEDGEGWYGLARVEEGDGRVEQAIRYYQNAANHGGVSWLPTWAWLREAGCQTQRGNRNAAAALLNRVLAEGTDIFGAQAEARAALKRLEE